MTLPGPDGVPGGALMVDEVRAGSSYQGNLVIGRKDLLEYAPGGCLDVFIALLSSFGFNP